MKTISSDMSIDVLSSIKNVFDLDSVSQVKCFVEYKKNQEESIDINKLVCYVVMLYSQDSPLNKKPIPPLGERKIKAAVISGFDPDSEYISETVMELGSSKVRDLVLDYMTSFFPVEWVERNIVSEQLYENQKIRLKPIQNKVVEPPKKKKKKPVEESDVVDEDIDVTQDDKYVNETALKKYNLTGHVDKYISLIKKYDTIIFMDNADVKNAAAKRSRMSLESRIKK